MAAVANTNPLMRQPASRWIMLGVVFVTLVWLLHSGGGGGDGGGASNGGTRYSVGANGGVPAGANNKDARYDNVRVEEQLRRIDEQAQRIAELEYELLQHSVEQSTRLGGGGGSGEECIDVRLEVGNLENELAKVKAQLRAAAAAAAAAQAGQDSDFGGGGRSIGGGGGDGSAFSEPVFEEAADITYLQQRLYDLQHPADCSTARVLILLHNNFAGFATQVRYMGAALQLGLYTDRTVIFGDGTQYATSSDCDMVAGDGQRTLDCYVLPYSSCTLANIGLSQSAVQSLTSAETHAVLEVRTFAQEMHDLTVNSDMRVRSIIPNNLEAFTIDALPLAFPVRNDYGRLWLSKECMRYALRMRPHVLEYVDGMARRIGLDITRPYVSVHIRHGDKRGGCFHTTEYYTKFIMKYTAEMGISQVHLASDDGAVFELLPSFLEPVVSVHYIPGDLFFNVGTGHAARELGDAAAAGHPLQFQEDQGLLLLTDMLLMARSSLMIGSLASNIDRAVYEMKSTLPQFPNVAYIDVDANSWVPNNFYSDGLDLQTGRKCGKTENRLQREAWLAEKVTTRQFAHKMMAETVGYSLDDMLFHMDFVEAAYKMHGGNGNGPPHWESVIPRKRSTLQKEYEGKTRRVDGEEVMVYIRHDEPMCPQ